MKDFLARELFLEMHPNKVSIRKSSQGADFLWYVILPHHRQLRTKTKRRIVKKLKDKVGEKRKNLISDYALNQSYNSYSGVWLHADSYRFEKELIYKLISAKK